MIVYDTSYEHTHTQRERDKDTGRESVRACLVVGSLFLPAIMFLTKVSALLQSLSLKD